MPRLTALCLMLLLAACTSVERPPEVPVLPPSLFGLYQDNDIGAINFAAWAFASPARTRNNPADAAKAVIAIEYLPGELSKSPRWLMMSPLTKQQMFTARADVRRALGIPQNVPPQLVVNALLQALPALYAGNLQAASRIFVPPAFTLPPGQTVQILANMPFIPSANVATMDAMSQEFPDGNTVRN
jgi:hypothetical protein